LPSSLCSVRQKGTVSVNFGVATWALMVWCSGLVTAALATGLGYVCQRTFAKRARLEREIAEAYLLNQDPTPDEKDLITSKRREMKTDYWSAVTYQQWAIVLAAFSLALFMAGALSALDSMAP
jgi:hypothetical protein